jgi:hypothetical protein
LKGVKRGKTPRSALSRKNIATSRWRLICIHYGQEKGDKMKILNLTLISAAAMAAAIANADTASTTTNPNTSNIQPGAGLSQNINPSTTPANPANPPDNSRTTTPTYPAQGGSISQGPPGNSGTGTLSTNPGVTGNTADMNNAAKVPVTPSLNTRQSIIDAQRALATQGFALTADGVMGPNTQSALRQFQARNGLSPTGVIDDQTLRALDARKNAVGEGLQ